MRATFVSASSLSALFQVPSKQITNRLTTRVGLSVAQLWPQNLCLWTAIGRIDLHYFVLARGALEPSPIHLSKLSIKSLSSASLHGFNVRSRLRFRMWLLT